ncbi:hypothetical protein TSUD_193890 [Trifolium subterraneum]|uniref:Uncharacterized protein n=1 Tax=Trifolium subterraneum TaxID=3900 RepID=A0A2Z6LM39_TRISU|nr:hypothetical protein TSUD_193890 [Trifolium subterraneum]
MDENFDGFNNKLPELKLDSKQTQGFLSFFKTLPDDPRAIRFFDRRACRYFGMFSNDSIQLIAK